MHHRVTDDTLRSFDNGGPEERGVILRTSVGFDGGLTHASCQESSLQDLHSSDGRRAPNGGYVNGVLVGANDRRLGSRPRGLSGTW